MIRLVLYLVGIALVAAGLAWLADRPGSLVVTWQGYVAETSVFRAVVLLSLLLALLVLAWSLFRQIWASPAVLGRFLTRRRQERGLDALSSGMIAVGAGDRALATRYALQARRSLPNEPLTHLLRAQAAHLAGDRTTARRIFEAMLGAPDTEQLGLRGLFLEAERAHEPIAARQYAERALKLNPKLAWPVDALFELQCTASDWAGALDTLDIGRRQGHIEKSVADRRRAVLLTAQAQDMEEANADRALDLALEAHQIAPSLIPAAAIAGRVFASRGSTAKAARVLEKTWKRSPHPDLAVAYAHARPGDSPRDRLDRVKRLARSTPHSVEGPIAMAHAAIDARDWTAARHALEPLLDARLTQRVCTLMARIEGEEKHDAGRVREWLARAVNAPRDPAWTADGVVSDRWAAISPVTGALDAFQWRVPVEPAGKEDRELLSSRLEELVDLGARDEPAIEAKPITVETASPVASDARLATPPASDRNSREPEPGSDKHPTPAGDAPPRTVATDKTATGDDPIPDGPGQNAEAEADPRPDSIGRPAARAAAGEAERNTARSEAASSASQPTKAFTPRSTTSEPRIFVPPHAPDDPGPEELPEGSTAHGRIAE